MKVKRGDLVTIAVSGDYGKPRPALIIQSDAFAETASATVLLLTSELHDWPIFRIRIQPTRHNGLQKVSDVMIDKSTTIPRHKLGRRMGQLDADSMRAIDAALATFLGLQE